MNQVAHMNQEHQPQSNSLVSKFADKFDVNPDSMIDTLKRTVFQQSNGQDITNEQMTMLLVVADQYGLNPFTREIYAFPDKGRVVPVVGVDGWANIINSHPAFDGMEFKQSDNMVQMNGSQPCPEWMECVIHRKDRAKPMIVREYIDEVYRAPFKQGMRGPWQTHTKRFFRHKTMIQAARIAFSFSGIYDQDEAEQIIAKDISNNVSVVEREKKAEPVYYSQEDFNENFPKWEKLINSGKQNPDRLIAMIESKAKPLTEDQKQEILILGEAQ